MQDSYLFKKLKVCYGDDIRIFRYHESVKVSDKLFKQLKTFVMDSFALEPDTFRITYVDEDKDKVTITGLEDFFDALNFTNKLFVIEVSKAQLKKFKKVMKLETINEDNKRKICRRKRNKKSKDLNCWEIKEDNEEEKKIISAVNEGAIKKIPTFFQAYGIFHFIKHDIDFRNSIKLCCLTAINSFAVQNELDFSTILEKKFNECKNIPDYNKSKLACLIYGISKYLGNPLVNDYAKQIYSALLNEGNYKSDFIEILNKIANKNNVSETIASYLKKLNKLLEKKPKKLCWKKRNKKCKDLKCWEIKENNEDEKKIISAGNEGAIKNKPTFFQSYGIFCDIRHNVNIRNYIKICCLTAINSFAVQNELDFSTILEKQFNECKNIPDYNKSKLACLIYRISKYLGNPLVNDYAKQIYSALLHEGNFKSDFIEILNKIANKNDVSETIASYLKKLNKLLEAKPKKICIPNVSLPNLNLPKAQSQKLPVASQKLPSLAGFSAKISSELPKKAKKSNNKVKDFLFKKLALKKIDNLEGLHRIQDYIVCKCNAILQQANVSDLCLNSGKPHITCTSCQKLITVFSKCYYCPNGRTNGHKDGLQLCMDCFSKHMSKELRLMNDDVLCICNNPFKRVKTEELTRVRFVKCNSCLDGVGIDSEFCWHCDSNSQKHPQGFDICETCYYNKIFESLAHNKKNNNKRSALSKAIAERKEGAKINKNPNKLEQSQNAILQTSLLKFDIIEQKRIEAEKREMARVGVEVPFEKISNLNVNQQIIQNNENQNHRNQLAANNQMNQMNQMVQVNQANNPEIHDNAFNHFNQNNPIMRNHQVYPQFPNQLFSQNNPIMQNNQNNQNIPQIQNNMFSQNNPIMQNNQVNQDSQNIPQIQNDMFSQNSQNNPNMQNNQNNPQIQNDLFSRNNQIMQNNQVNQDKQEMQDSSQDIKNKDAPMNKMEIVESKIFEPSAPPIENKKNQIQVQKEIIELNSDDEEINKDKDQMQEKKVDLSLDVKINNQFDDLKKALNLDQAQKQKQTNDNFKYKIELQQINCMGFAEEEIIRDLLVKQKGDVAKVITQLIELSL